MHVNATARFMRAECSCGKVGPSKLCHVPASKVQSLEFPVAGMQLAERLKANLRTVEERQAELAAAIDSCKAGGSQVHP